MSGNKRDYSLFISDIIDSSRKIVSLTENTGYSEFVEDWVKHDAILRNLEIIGEAAKKIPDEIRAKHKDIEWREMAGLRDIITHKYFGIDDVIIWNIITDKIPALLKSLIK
jgi:uncharacterized protein with HEPN domain